MKHVIRLWVIVAVAACAVGQSWADDIKFPPWQRFTDGTTYQRWDFLTDDTTALPEDDAYNPYGQSYIDIYQVPPGWLPLADGREGVWPLSGRMDAVIPNREDPYPYKDIWVQITWEPMCLDPPSSPTVVATAEDSADPVAAELVQQVALESSWLHSTYQIHLEPNPRYEHVEITGAIYVDQVVIDTICIPEPATLALVCLGVSGLIARNRR